MAWAATRVAWAAWAARAWAARAWAARAWAAREAWEAWVTKEVSTLTFSLYNGSYCALLTTMVLQAVAWEVEAWEEEAWEVEAWEV